MADADARFEAADPAKGPLVQARARPKPKDARAPYHQALDPDHEDDLLQAIGQGLALVGARERQSPIAIVGAIVEYIDALRDGTERPTTDPTDTALALACLLGHQISREFGWGWAHVRRTRAPGIAIVSPDCRHVAAPRRIVDSALEEGGAVVRAFFEKARSAPELPGRERYVRLR